MPSPQGRVVLDWKEFGHHFQVEELDPPVLKGAGYRTHRLWNNGYPAVGWQWCYDLAGARRSASYLLQHSYVNRIEYLEREVHRLMIVEAKANGTYMEAKGDND